MSTFRTSLRIVAAHRVIILVYLLTLSMFGLLMGLSVTRPTCTPPWRWSTVTARRSPGA